MKGLDWVVAPLALISFALCLAVIPWFVPDPDLIIVCMLAIAGAAYDFWRMAFGSRNGNNQQNGQR
jgi:hypothetical protein